MLSTNSTYLWFVLGKTVTSKVEKKQKKHAVWDEEGIPHMQDKSSHVKP